LILSVTRKDFTTLFDGMKTLLTDRIYEEDKIRELVGHNRITNDRLESLNQIPVLSPGFLYRDCPWDYVSILKSLHSGKAFDLAIKKPSGILFSYVGNRPNRNQNSTNPGGYIKREVVSSLKRKILLHSDGRKSIAELAHALAGCSDAVPTQRHAAFAIESLVKEGILCLRDKTAAENVGSARIKIRDLE